MQFGKYGEEKIFCPSVNQTPYICFLNLDEWLFYFFDPEDDGSIVR
jgi:hypothetical protein